jgi:hypothetical protein
MILMFAATFPAAIAFLPFKHFEQNLTGALQRLQRAVKQFNHKGAEGA